MHTELDEHPWYIPPKPDWKELNLAELDDLRRRWITENEAKLREVMFVTRTLGKQYPSPRLRPENRNYLYQITDGDDHWVYFYTRRPADTYNVAGQQLDYVESIGILKNGYLNQDGVPSGDSYVFAEFLNEKLIYNELTDRKSVV